MNDHTKSVACVALCRLDPQTPIELRKMAAEAHGRTLAYNVGAFVRFCSRYTHVYMHACIVFFICASQANPSILCCMMHGHPAGKEIGPSPSFCFGFGNVILADVEESGGGLQKQRSMNVLELTWGYKSGIESCLMRNFEKRR